MTTCEKCGGHKLSEHRCPVCGYSGEPGELISLAEARSKRDAPDPQFVRTDDDNRPMYCYSVRYAMNGKQWGGVSIWAYDYDEALRRMEAIRATGQIDGQLLSERPE